MIAIVCITASLMGWTRGRSFRFSDGPLFSLRCDLADWTPDRVVDRGVLDEVVNRHHVLMDEEVADGVDDEDETDEEGALAQKRQEDDGANGLAEDDERGDHRIPLEVDAGGYGELGERRTGDRTGIEVDDHEHQTGDE